MTENSVTPQYPGLQVKREEFCSPADTTHQEIDERLPAIRKRNAVSEQHFGW